ncbi:MAG: phenylacetate-coenzyme A ligase PaaK-like adenylate-forming protein, partial [Motiliproteus sp.]
MVVSIKKIGIIYTVIAVFGINMTTTRPFDWPSNVDFNGTPLPSLVKRLEDVAFGSIKELKAGQQQQLTRLDDWFAKTSALYRQRKDAVGLAGVAITLENLHKLPVLTRRQLQSAGEGMFCDPPVSHQPAIKTSTSGSTGEPVTLQ